MFSRLFSRKPANPVPQQLYGSVVAQSRNPLFFTEFGFHDTVISRFDVLCLHLFLFSRRLVRSPSPLAASLNQEVFDIFTDETDRALRELGVGDTSVPKRKKKMVRTFYAMVDEFSKPLDEADQSGLLNAMTARFGQTTTRSAEAVQCRPLMTYVANCARALDAQTDEAILAGELSWPSAQKGSKASKSEAG
jgi:cytochrome b pre-mRNA-processing protein 3